MEHLLSLGDDSIRCVFTQEISVLWSMDEVAWSYIVLMLAIIPWLLYVIVIGLYTISIMYGYLKLHTMTDPHVYVDELPGVSIIKPLMGVDPYLEYNLESHFTINYPKFELLLCIQDDQDPAIDLVRKLMDRYPKVDCTLFIGGKNGILNPMVDNMAPAYENCKYSLIWVATSRIEVNTDMLLDMVGKLHLPKVALVHQLPYTANNSGFTAALEKVYFGSNVGHYYVALHVLGVSCFTGMSYLFNKSRLEELNGLLWFGQYLAEDFFIAKLLQERGYRHQLAAYPALQNVARTSVATYKDRMVRWLRLRMNMVPIAACLLEPLGQCLILGVYASWSANYLFHINPFYWFICHVCVWCITDYILLRQVQCGPLPFSLSTFVGAWLVEELLFFFIYFEALINVRHIKWGKRTYKLSHFGRMVNILPDKKAAFII